MEETGTKLTTEEYINKMLFEGWGRNEPVWNEEPHTFLVHSDILKHVKIFLKHFNINSYEVLKYPLQVGIKLYDMCIISRLLTDESILPKRRLFDSIMHSQFSFVWESNPTLFIEVKSFTIFKDFIRKYDIEQYIIDVKEQPGISESGNMIKVVTFHPSVDGHLEDMLPKFDHHLYLSETHHPPKYYYMSLAFEWINPQFKEFFIENGYSALYIILKELSFTNYLDIFDLVSLRWALFHFGSSPCPLKEEIDYTINRELSKFVENNHFDIPQYLIDKNITISSELITQYLVYEFQHCFKTVYVADRGVYTMMTTIKLVNDPNVVNKIKNKNNVEFKIDGSGYNQMSLSLLLDLIKCKNVRSITLDTNHMWNHDVTKFYEVVELECQIKLKGNNYYYFVEHFLSSLKTVRNLEALPWSEIIFYGNQINDYSIFDKLFVKLISFSRISINRCMLEQLNKCDLRTSIQFLKCSLETTRQITPEGTYHNWYNWALLMQLEDIFIDIKEDEDTWESVCEFVCSEMAKTDSQEFFFDQERYIQISSLETEINLIDILFKINQETGQLEIYDKSCNIIMDYYCLKNNIKPDKDKFDYDFYQ